VRGVEADIAALRQKLDALATEPDDGLSQRYVLRRPQLPKTLYWQLRRLAAETLRLLDRIGLRDGSPWPAQLKHMPGSAKAAPLLIWAQGMDRDTLREACRGLQRLLGDMPDFAPVLLTDVADFAFFSRLGWMVEYLPELDGEGESYAARKARLVARIYKDAPVVPAEVGLHQDLATADLRRWIRSRSA
jgi:hypothetical protein